MQVTEVLLFDNGQNALMKCKYHFPACLELQKMLEGTGYSVDLLTSPGGTSAQIRKGSMVVLTTGAYLAGTPLAAFNRLLADAKTNLKITRLLQQKKIK